MVKWSGHAKQDLRQIYDFIARDSIHYAKKVAQDLVEKTRTLDELPRIGRVVPEIGNESVRELSLYSYRILYEIVGTQIYVLTIVHKRRNWTPDEIEKPK